MKKTVGVKWGGLKVGIVLVLAISAMLWASLTGGGTSIFDPKWSFECYFKNVNGLVSGAPVWMSGVEVGNVRSVSFVNLDSLRQVKLICRMKKSAWDMMTEGAAVQLGTIGLLGDRYVEIIPGPKGKPTLPRGAILPTLDVGEASKMFQAGEDAIGEARSVVQGIDELLTGINSGEGTLGQLAEDDKMYHQMTALLGKLTLLVGDLQKNQERIYSSIENSSSAIETLAQRVESNEGTVGKLLSDPELYNNINNMSLRLDSVMSRIDNAEGSLGLLVSDTSLYVEVVDLMARMNTLVTDMQDNPKKYFKVSVF